MKQQEVNQMIRDVRSILEENVNSAPLEGVTDVGTISINKVIETMLPKAVDSIVNVAPMELFMQPKYRRISADNAWAQYISCHSGAQSVASIPMKFFMRSGITIETPLANWITYTIGENDTMTISLAANESAQIRTGELKFMDGTETVTKVTFRQNATGTNAPSFQERPNCDGLAELFSAFLGGYISKPDDYLRTLYINVNSWERPVMDLTPLSSPYVSIARSEINLSVGNEEKPLAVDSFQNGHGCIELYPLTKDNTAELVYVERSKIETVNNVKMVNCDDGIYHAVCFFAAYLVAMTKSYANAAAYQTAAMNCINKLPVPVNATSGAPVQQ